VQESPQCHALFRRGISFGFLAVGGYGRRELCLHSDIDLVILFDKRIPQEASGIVTEILYPLWDLGLELGYGTRTVKDCMKLAAEDLEVLTSLMDARFLCGDSPLFLKLAEKLQRKVFRPRSRVLVEKLLADQDARTQKFGDASHRLEPDLKEGIGGLRDYHHMLWMAKALLGLRVPRDLEVLGALSSSEYDQLCKHLDVVWQIRRHLHRLSGRANDRLYFEYQDPIAQTLGYPERKGFPPVEQFLGRLHEAMAGIKALHRAFVEDHVTSPSKQSVPVHVRGLPPALSAGKRGLSFGSPEAIPADPPLLMEIFWWSARSGMTLSREALRLVGEFLHLVDHRFRTKPQVSDRFLEMLRAPYLHQALEKMLESGFLENLIPEFLPIKDRVQFDAYHVFPVGWHCLETVRHLKEISRQQDILLPGILEDLPDPTPLLLGALLHDIGKAGKNHAERGARMARPILDRLGCAPAVREDVVFLIRYHLLLFETATRRDLNDEKSVVLFASRVENINRLKMLYLLTWADSKATGPKSWNEWIAGLTQELFFKALHVLEREELATVSASRKMKRKLGALRKKIGPETSEKALGAVTDQMTPRYLLNISPGEIARHAMISLALKKENAPGDFPAFHLDARPASTQETWEVTVLAQDRPGLFADLTGVLAVNDINILSADIYTWRDGTAVDLFRVTGPLDPLHPEEAWDKVRRDVARTLAGKMDLESRLRAKRSSLVLKGSHGPTRPPLVTLDNDGSDFFTLVEVFAPDRIGLLHTISKTLFELGVDIRIAKIGTKGDQVADVFYVRDFVGRKILEPEAMEKIRRSLTRRLEQDVFQPGAQTALTGAPKRSGARRAC